MELRSLQDLSCFFTLLEEFILPSTEENCRLQEQCSFSQPPKMSVGCFSADRENCQWESHDHANQMQKIKGVGDRIQLLKKRKKN